MGWITPKTDWSGATDAQGNYTGDRFNAGDFNRIKNNLEYLRNLAIVLYTDFDIVSLGADRTAVDYFYADEINQLEANLTTVSERSVQVDYGEARVYEDNQPTMNYEELNRLEGAILDLYNRMLTLLGGVRMFTWNFGMKGGDF